MRAALAHAATFFEQELPAVRAWPFDAAGARGIAVPVLAVMGGGSPQVSASWPRRQEFLLAHLPQVEAHVLPGARHMLALQAGATLAQRLDEFFGEQARGLSPFARKRGMSPFFCAYTSYVGGLHRRRALRGIIRLQLF
jgi:alpha-beta hydrolase superfamily lysophospholipase